jgi:hemerythrin-like domain-containing protein
LGAGLKLSGPGLGAQLRVNCLTVCHGLHYHHTSEDAGIFPFLAGRHPELAPTLDRLRREHQKIAALLDDLQKVISTDGADPLLVLPEVERLTDELESHLTYEEEQLIPILDASTP